MKNRESRQEKLLWWSEMFVRVLMWLIGVVMMFVIEKRDLPVITYVLPAVVMLMLAFRVTKYNQKRGKRY